MWARRSRGKGITQTLSSSTDKLYGKMFDLQHIIFLLTPRSLPSSTPPSPLAPISAFWIKPVAAMDEDLLFVVDQAKGNNFGLILYSFGPRQQHEGPPCYVKAQYLNPIWCRWGEPHVRGSDVVGDHQQKAPVTPARVQPASLPL
ncbi:hypothetical protein Fmac_021911 [Flemingia macrophylla]|uniref:DUF4283 domain-containing protein n=1 Tax=Flemingia macrophylla TaxID=520843 RepID=A0ABD1LY86_9FABA